MATDFSQNKRVRFQSLGLVDYPQAWDYQSARFQGILAQKLANRQRERDGQPLQPTDNYLLFCSHPHVYTLGKTGQRENLLVSEDELDQLGATFYPINRGGDITYHGPGQLVAYPILDLDNFFTDIHRYLRLLEEAVIFTLADYGVAAGRMDGLTGVWIGMDTPNPRKICAMGVKASRWVTMHGLAFNLNVDLSYFGHIVPCGIADKAVTSLAQELGHPVDEAEAAERLKGHLAALFGMELASEPGPAVGEAMTR